MRSSTRTEYEQRLRYVLGLALARLDATPSSAELANSAGFSRFHFGRIVLGALGESLSDCLRRLRLERSAWQLEHTATSITEIAFDAGYASHEAYTRAFASAYNCNPSEYRAKPFPYKIPASSGLHWSPELRVDDVEFDLDAEKSMNIEVQTLEPFNIVGLVHRGHYQEIGGTFDKLGPLIGQHSVPAGDFLGVYHEDPESTPIEELSSYAAVKVPEGYDPPGSDLVKSNVAGGEYAVTTHLGPYSELGDVWTKFVGQVIPANGYEPAPAPSFEIYVNDFRSVPPEEVRTDIYVPIKPR